MSRILDLSGVWNCQVPGFPGQEIALPGTLEEAGIGHPDDPGNQWKVDEVRRIGFYREGDPIVTRLTRSFVYEGPARFSRHLEQTLPAGCRAFVDVERSRHLTLSLNGQPVPPQGAPNIITPYTFEVTELLTGRDELALICDNSYPGWPRDAIVYASAASDETQTNWNGLLGNLHLRLERSCFLRRVRVYPKGDALDVYVDLDLAKPWHGTLSIRSDILVRGEVSLPVDLPSGCSTVHSGPLSILPDAGRWGPDQPLLHCVTVSAPGMEDCSVRFGLRDFSARDGHLTLNGRRIFLRSETNCAVFPETGYIPKDTASWKTILQKYRAYGVNCVRFHSHCPPEAAFTAADQLGMLMQPELSHWDPEHAFLSPEARSYYEGELTETLAWLANHPSFVMLTFGNELHTDEEGRAFMTGLLEKARVLDKTRLYANGSNTEYGQQGADPASDFYTSMRYLEMEMRATCDGMTGWLNHEYPGSCHHYQHTVEALRNSSAQPVFSFEVGQYEILPDFRETEAYRGITRPENLRHIQRKIQERKIDGETWHHMVEATGESSLLCYRAEVESALRTEGFSGISLLGLQDFPGQGTALVGMMDAHLHPKPYDFARPERFASFFRDTLPLACLPRYTYFRGESLSIPLRIAHYGCGDLQGDAEWELAGDSWHRKGTLAPVTARAGRLTDLGNAEILLDLPGDSARLTLRISFCGISNEYPLWVYSDDPAICPEAVYECRRLDDRAETVLRAGGTVYYAPDSTEEALPPSLPCHFSPDFWSVCTFPHQSGTMGQLIDSGHPLFQSFPTERFSNWQWWPMAGQRALILPRPMACLVYEMDSYAFLRPLGKLLECRCLAGRLMISSLGLHQLQRYPETRALQRAVYRYLSEDPAPCENHLDWQEAVRWLRSKQTEQF